MAHETKAQTLDRVLNPTDVRNRLAPLTPALEIARLAVDYQRARAEGRMDDAAALKRQAFALKAAELGITYEVFASEQAAYVAEREAPAACPSCGDPVAIAGLCGACAEQGACPNCAALGCGCMADYRPNYAWLVTHA